MRISDWSSDVCSSDLAHFQDKSRGARGKHTSSDVRKALEVRHSDGLYLGDYIQVAVNLTLVSLYFSNCQRPNRAAHRHWMPSIWRQPSSSTTSRSEEHTSELQSLMRNSYAVFCLKKKHKTKHNTTNR